MSLKHYCLVNLDSTVQYSIFLSAGCVTKAIFSAGSVLTDGTSINRSNACGFADPIKFDRSGANQLNPSIKCFHFEILVLFFSILLVLKTRCSREFLFLVLG